MTFATRPDGRLECVNVMLGRRAFGHLVESNPMHLRVRLGHGGDLILSAATGAGVITDVPWQARLEGESYEQCVARGRKRLGLDKPSLAPIRSTAVADEFAKTRASRRGAARKAR